MFWVLGTFGFINKLKNIFKQTIVNKNNFSTYDSLKTAQHAQCQGVDF